MPTLLCLIAAIAVSVSAVGCGSLNTVRYQAPSIKDAGTPWEAARDGIAFSVDGICFFVEDGSKDIQLRVMTLLGVPILPVSLGGDAPSGPAYFDVMLWLIPEQGNADYPFDVPRIELEFENGSLVGPNTVQVSRFRTKWEKEPVYWFTPDIVETILYPEHWGNKPLDDFIEPLALWDWTRLIVRFEKPAPSVRPVTLYIRGVARKQLVQNVPAVTFAPISELRQVFPGRWADGTWLSDFPVRACRKLQQASNEP